MDGDKPDPHQKKRVLSTDLRQPSVRKKAKTDSLLDSILSDITEHTPKKVDRLAEMKQKNVDDLHNLFLNAFLSAKDAPKTTQVEIEARIGSFTGSGFKSGVTKQEFDYLVRFFRSQNKGECDMIQETDFIYTSPIAEMPGNLRVTFDYEEQTAIRATIKNRTRNQTMQFGDFPYDLRLSVSSEISVPMPEVLPPNYEKKRKKIRYSFLNESAGNRWRIDMTKVVSIEDNGEDEGKGQYATVYEVEFEVLNHTLLAFGNEYYLKDTAEEFYNMLVSTIQGLMKAQSDPFPDINTERIESGDDLDQLKAHVRACLRMHSSFDDFPGSMPVTFSRRHFPTIQRVPYYVSEKTDGIRYLMLVLENGAFLIDRKFSFNFITDFESLTELYGSQGPSLIDGELVRHTLTGKPIFMVFDVVTMHNQYYGDKTLSDRLQIIGKHVVTPYRQAVQEGKIPKDHPFLIMGKVFFPKEKLDKVFERIKKDEKTGHRYYTDEKRHHKTDGIIFTPDEHYNIRTTNNLFKWKYTDKLSADFRVRPTKNEAEFTFLALADTGEVECKVVSLSERDRHQMQKDIAGHPNLKHIIGEFVYDSWTGFWKYMTLRTDKVKPNAMRVVFDTLESIAENISKEELIYRLQMPPEKDDFRQKMMSLQASLVKGVKPNGPSQAPPHSNPQV